MNNIIKHRLPAMILASVIFLAVSRAGAQIPPGYYDPAAGKTGTALQSALHNIIKGHTVISYSGIIGYFPSTDAKPGNVVWDMYSDVPGGTPPYIYHYSSGDECGNYNGEGDCYNREHSWPKSWFNDVAPMNSDMFHIYPTDGYVNGKRSNYAYGTVSSPSWTSQNGSKLGSCTWPGFSGTAFEPIDAYKGDFARTYFYMSTRYYTEDSGWNTTDMTIKSQLKPWALQMMLHWHNTDPVSPKETSRNNALYGIQHNRNPFIDHPEYAAMIWGNPVGEEEMTANTGILTAWPNPSAGLCRIALPVKASVSTPVVTVLSLDGRQSVPAFTLEGNILEIDLGSYTPGFYVIMINGEEFRFMARVVRIK